MSQVLRYEESSSRIPPLSSQYMDLADPSIKLEKRSQSTSSITQPSHQGPHYAKASRTHHHTSRNISNPSRPLTEYISTSENVHRPPEPSRGLSDQPRHSNNIHPPYLPTVIRRHSSPPPNQMNVALRSVSDSVVRETPKEFHLQSAGLEEISSRKPTEMLRPAPSTGSMESASSSVSSSPSHHLNDASTPEIANLVAAAGSAEAVIEYLLKEKKSQTAQNTQLWRLVDKQRAMILGLNKDLERALKDKEHYRKKTKALLADMLGLHKDRHLVPNNMDSPNEDRTRRISVENFKINAFKEDKTTDLDSPINVVLAPYPVTPSASRFDSSVSSNLFEPEQHMPPTLVDELKDLEEFTPSFIHALTRDESPEFLPPEKYLPTSQPPNLPLPNIPTAKELPLQTILSEKGDHQQRRSPPLPIHLENPGTSVTQRDVHPDRRRPAKPDHESETFSKDDTLTNMETSRSTASDNSSLTAPEQHMETNTKLGDSNINTKANKHIRQPSSPRIAALRTTPRPSRDTSSPTNCINQIPTVNSPPPSPLIVFQVPQYTSDVPLQGNHQSVPFPPSTPTSLSSSGSIRAQFQKSPKPPLITKSEQDSGSSSDDNLLSPDTHDPRRDGIYRGLVTEEFPELLLPPKALNLVDVKVASSRLKPSRASIMSSKSFEEDPVFTLALFARSNGKELWRIEKDLQSLLVLDQALKQSSTVRAPEKSLFNGHAPAKVDARRIALNAYFEKLLECQHAATSALEICKYLSSNVIEANTKDLNPAPSFGLATSGYVSNELMRMPRKRGYLTKRGKNFGGWKARYFVLGGPILRYYDSPNGQNLGTIKLPNAQIGKQSQPSAKNLTLRADSDESENQYRHAFLILEPKKKDSSSLVRHVLCAESDAERDEWVEALCQYIGFKEPEENNSQLPPTGKIGTSTSSNSSDKRLKKNDSNSQDQAFDSSGDSLLGVSYENTKVGNKPFLGRKKDSNGIGPAPGAMGRESPIPAQKLVAKPTPTPKAVSSSQENNIGRHLENSVSLSDEKIKLRKRSFFGFGHKVREQAETIEIDPNKYLTQMVLEPRGPIRHVFGASLMDAVKYSHPVNVKVGLPAVVYRCVEYLDANNACGEEGIFRLSGSNVVIKQLRERFNTEGDVNLVTDEQYYDIHAVASLLKLYLRELPTTILTMQLHLQFVAVTEVSDVNDRISVVNQLVHQLPQENYILLRYMLSFLNKIISHANVNKMTVRNVGIVFSPTLNIPASLFSLFLQQYTKIFDDQLSQNQDQNIAVPNPKGSPENTKAPSRQGTSPSPPNTRRPPFPMSKLQYSSNANNEEVQNSHLSSGNGATIDQESRKERTTTKAIATSDNPTVNKSNRQYSPVNPSEKARRRDSSMFGINMAGLGQRRASISKSGSLRTANGSYFI
ncbi:BgTH12-05817 [Blumeria graminis f. sp. triticale]|uniref:BgTH12-05817 n=1 Tax=Blumeria graminis f. sp. triticale TaxID=1689686 RepID=A0A9W4GHN8_BLUGR|nr:BgTH12-05817 [Blumeria graminis f. sp. triticale]